MSPLYLSYLHALLSHHRVAPPFAWFHSLLERSQAWLSSFSTWPPKAPPNPACPQLIFLAATLLTPPPTDYVRRRRSRGRTVGVHWVLDRALGCLHTLVLVPWDVHYLAFNITTHPVPCYAWHHHFTSVSCLLIKHPSHSTSVVVTYSLMQRNDFTPPTEHQSGSFPVSWSSLFSSQTFLRTPPHVHSFT